MFKGIFITIEGTDGSGKGTQTELLVKKLQNENHEVEIISFPRYGERSATMVEDYLTGKFGTAEEVGPYRASIFFAADRYAAAPLIRQWLANGKIVIANRYVGSNMAHNGGKIADPAEREKFFAWVDGLEYTIFGIPRPDFSLILHVSPEISQKLVDQKTLTGREYLHGKKRDIHEDDLHHLRMAEESYVHLSEKFPNYRMLECAPNGNLLSIDAVQKNVWTTINPIIQSFIHRNQ